jgi:hypothetical protein
MTREQREFIKGYCNGQYESGNQDHPLVKENFQKAERCIAEDDKTLPLVLAYWKGWLDGIQAEVEA